MVKHSVKDLKGQLDKSIEDLTVINKAIESLNIIIKGNPTNKLYGQLDTLSRRKKMADDKVKYYKDKLTNFGKAKITSVIMQVEEGNGLEHFENGSTLIANYIDVSNEDVRILTDYWSSELNIKIKILEIDDSHTFLKKVVL